MFLKEIWNFNFVLIVLDEFSNFLPIAYLVLFPLKTFLEARYTNGLSGRFLAIRKGQSLAADRRREEDVLSSVPIY
jgi:hypothetical protein